MTRKLCAFFISFLLCISLLFFGASYGVTAAYAENAASASSYEASTMKLLRHEGTVDIFDINGTPRFLLEGVRFLSGESMLTGEDGTASVGLDDTKIVSLDHNTRVEFIQEDNHMQLNLLEGELFLDVSEKLDENASFDIQTTTMTVGIRGTIISASSKSLPDGTNLTIIAVYEGGGEVNFQDKNGTNRVVPLSPGQQIIAQENLVSPDNQSGVNPVVTDITGDNISTFAANEITSNETILDRVVNGSPEGGKMLEPGNGEDEYGSFPADGDWYFPGEVVIVAQSASKLYDGAPLVRPADALVFGLPGNFNISVSCSGSITNAGSEDNVISSYNITNAAGENVNSHFPSIRTVPGKLVVDRAPLTVWTGSAEKEYDGEPLICEEAGIRTVSGYNADEPTWQNTSIITETALGSEQMIAVSGRMFIHGSNPLTQETKSIELKVGQRLSVALKKGASGNSLEFVIEDLTEEDLPEEVLRLYAENPDLLTAACEETHWDIEKIKGRIAELKPLEEKTVSVNGLDVASSDQENIMSDSANIRISVDTQITNYATRVLTSNEADFTPIKLDESIKVYTTGSQTEIGQSENTYEIDWGNADERNYILRDDLGTLTVKSIAPVTLTAPSAEKVYDGQPLKADDEVKAEGLPKGYTFKAVVDGSQTEVGESESKITSYKIFDKQKNNVTDAFEKVNLKKGKLTVTPLSVSISIGTGSASYSGAAYAPTPVLTYENGDRKGETVSPATVTTASQPHLLASVKPVKRAAAGDKVYRFNLFTGDTVDLTLSGMGTGVGSFTLQAFVTSSSGNISCPVSSISGTSVTIEPAVLTISTASASKFYDGEPLTCADVTVEGLAPGDTITVIATGTITDVGVADNTYTIDWGTVDKNNYTVTSVLGILTVTAPPETPTPDPTETPKPQITFLAPVLDKVYDGTPLTASSADVKVEGLPEGYTYSVTLSGSQTDVGECECAITAYTILDASGKDVSDLCTVTSAPGSLAVLPCPVVFSSLGGTTTYGEDVYFSASCTVNGTAVSGTVDLNEDGDFRATYSLCGSNSILFEGGQVPSRDTYPGTYYLDIGYLLDGDDNNYSVTVDDVIYTIDKATLTVTTPSQTKKYDGTPNPVSEDATVTGDPFGNIWAEAIGSKDGSDVGTHTNGYKIYISYDDPDNYNIVENLGTLTIEKRDITITSASADKKYDGSPLTCEEFGITGDGLTDSDRIHCSFTGSQKDVGESKNEFTVSGESGTNLDNYNVTTAFGDLVVNKRNVTMTSGDDTKYVLNGDPTDLHSVSGELPSNHTVTVSGDGFVEGEGVTYTFDDPPTVPGQYPNTFTWTFNEGTNGNNYNITPVYGTLTYHIHEGSSGLRIVADSAQKVFDGTPLTAPGYTAENVPEGYTFYNVVVEGSQTDVGNSANNVTSYDLLDGNGQRYNGPGSKHSGSLTVKPCPLVFDLNYATVTYKHWINPFPAATCNGTAVSSGGSADNTFTLPTGDVVNLVVSGIPSTDAAPGTYTITPSCSFSSGNASNYTISYNNTTLTIQPITITINLGGRTVPFDGNEQGFDINAVSAACSYGSCSLVMNSGVVGHCTYTGTLDNGDTFTLEVTGRGITPGDYTITGSASFTSGDASVYSFAYTNNNLKIEESEPVNTDSTMPDPENTDGDVPPSGYPDP